VEIFWDFLQAGIIGNFAWGNLVMLAVGCVFIYLGIAKDYEPLLLVPIGFGMLVGNIPLRDRHEHRHLRGGSVLIRSSTQGVTPGLVSAADLPRHRGHDRLLGHALEPAPDPAGCGGAGGHLLDLRSVRWRSASRRKRPPRSASSAAPTGRPPSSSPVSWRRTCSVRSPSRPTSYMALVPVIQPPIIKLLTTRERSD
jgi:hypothetical protein